MTFKELKRTIYCDLYRYYGYANKRLLFRLLFLIPLPGFVFSFYLRCTHYFYYNKYTRRNLYYLFLFILRRHKFKYGIDISHKTKIGKGLYISHFGNIIIHGSAEIGENCNISPGIVIGVSNRGKHAGIPKIGSEVFIGPGAKIFGNITIGNKVSIGANAVVTTDVPENAVVTGIPAKVISYDGSEGYVNNKV